MKIVFVDLFSSMAFERNSFDAVNEKHYPNVIKAENEEEFLYSLNGKTPDVIILNPVLPPSVLSDSKIKFITSDLPKGAVGFELFKKMTKLTESAEKKPKIVLYTVTPFENLVDVGFPENLKAHYLQKPAFTKELLQKIEE
jgi:hypothetical protein